MRAQRGLKSILKHISSDLPMVSLSINVLIPHNDQNIIKFSRSKSFNYDGIAGSGIHEIFWRWKHSWTELKAPAAITG